MNCPICNNDQVQTYVKLPRDREYFVTRQKNSSYFRCSRCELIFLEPRPSAEETSTFYTASYQNYSKSKAPLISDLFDLLQNLSLRSFSKKIHLDSKILDYGCNQGQFLKLLSNYKYKNLYGYDVVSLEDNNLSGFVFFDDLNELLNSGMSFDVIRMNHVIEHLPNVDNIMNTLRKLLTPNGRIIGQTPNSNHYTAKLFNEFWGGLHFPYHLSLFSHKSLSIGSKSWGLKLTKTSPTIVPTGWAMSFENILKKYFFISHSGRTPIYIVLLLFSAPFVIVDRIFAAFFSTAIIDFELVKDTSK